jgi:hypothetical protein
MDFASIVKKETPVNQEKEIIIEDNNNVIDHQEEPIESKWSSYFSFNIIDLFSDLKYDFNILLNNCNINDFFDFAIQNSKIFDPRQDHEDSGSETENDSEYFSD